jgi:MFS family permease
MKATPPAPPHTDSRRFALWLSLPQLITWGSVFYTFAVLVQPVERELGLSRAQSSLAFSLAMLAEGLLAYPIGRWIDRGHERAVMTGGSLVMAAGLVAHSFVQDAAGFYAVWLLLGAALAATLYTPVFAIVTRRFPHDFRRAIITLTFLGGLASTVFIPLSAWLVAELGWRQALWVLAAMHLLVCAPLHAHWLRHAPRVAVAHAATAGAAMPTTAARHMRSAPFLLIGVFAVGMMGVTAALPPHLVSLLRETGLAEAWAIAIPATIGLVQVLGRLLLYFFESRIDVHTANRWIPWLIPLSLAALLGAIGWPVSSVLLGPAFALVFVIVFVMFYGMGNGMLTIVKGTVIAQYVSQAHVASLNGALGLPIALARAVAPLALGMLWTPGVGYAAGIGLMLAVSLMAIAALLMAQRRALRQGDLSA